MRSFLTLIAFFLLINTTSAQDITLRGTAKDIATGLSIESSTIVVIGTSIAAKSDNNGKFILKISKANMGSSMSVSSHGYKAFSVPILLNKVNYEVLLEPVDNDLGDVVVTGVSRATLKYATNNPLTLELQVNNLFVKAYLSNLNRSKYFEYYHASPTGNLGIFNMGRSVNLKVNIPF